MSTTASQRRGPTLWTAGDWNAFFGFGTNILVNMLVVTGLLRFVLKMPDALVFGRILPALGLMMCLSTFYYAFLAYRLARRTGRSDVCALPSGVSVPSMRPALEMYMTPVIGITCFVIILVSWFAGYTYAKNIPAGLVAIAVGIVIAWGSNIFGLGLGGMSIEKLTGAFANFGFSVPMPAADPWSDVGQIQLSPPTLRGPRRASGYPSHTGPSYRSSADLPLCAKSCPEQTQQSRTEVGW